MLYQTLTPAEVDREGAFLELRISEEWLYHQIFHGTWDQVDTARWQRNRAIQVYAGTLPPGLGDHCFHEYRTNERGHQICRKCHRYSALAGLMHAKP